VTEETQSSLTSLKELMVLLTETLQDFLTIVSTNRHRRSAGCEKASEKAEVLHKLQNLYNSAIGNTTAMQNDTNADISAFSKETISTLSFHLSMVNIELKDLETKC